jgi:pyruvate dehydrogenase E2 component (dihydrolipoyllysine-residue acetyltransferase)
VASLVEVRVPDIGDYKDVEVIDVAAKPGDAIALEGAVVTLETEKATMDIPSTAAGVVREIKVKRGDRVSEGDVLAIVEAEAAAEPKPAVATQSVPPAATPTPPQASAPPVAPARASQAAVPVRATSAPIDEPGFSRSHASPSVRRFARELGADLAKVQGTGAKGRVTADDVKSYVKKILTAPAAAGAALPRVPEVDFAAFGPIERKPLGRIQKISGSRLHASWVNIPHVTQFDEADITEMEAARARLKDEAAAKGIKLTPLAFVMRACVKTLAEFPQFCTSLDTAAGELVFKRYVHIGFAADTPNGLVVPVVRDADRKDVFELARELAALSEKARSGKLSPGEMQGGCFTISSLGGIGGTAFTPIINAPEVAILGVSRSAQRAVFQDGQFVARLMLPLSLSYDHRVIDGAAAARFTTFLGKTLADAAGLLQAIP